MADASHELRTPVATTRTAAGVALQQPHRDETEYRETLRDRRAAGGAAVARRGRHVHAGARRRRQLSGAHRRRCTSTRWSTRSCARRAWWRRRRNVSVETRDGPVGGVHRRRGADPPDDRATSSTTPSVTRRPAAPCGSSSTRPATGYAIAVKDQGPGIPPRSGRRSSSDSSAATCRADRGRARRCRTGAGARALDRQGPWRRRRAGALVAVRLDVRHLAAVAQSIVGAAFMAAAILLCLSSVHPPSGLCLQEKGRAPMKMTRQQWIPLAACWRQSRWLCTPSSSCRVRRRRRPPTSRRPHRPGQGCAGADRAAGRVHGAGGGGRRARAPRDAGCRRASMPMPPARRRWSSRRPQ